MKKITLITPTLNAERFLEPMLASVHGQGYPNLEHIVIDGGSSDRTLSIIDRYRDGLAHLISEQDRGLYDALIKGFALATGDIYGWINADDLLMPRSLFSINMAFNTGERIDWITGSPSCVTEDGMIYPAAVQGHTRRLYRRDEFLHGEFYPIQQESTFFTAGLYRSIGGLSSRYRVAGDYELWAKCFEQTPLTLFNVYLGAFRKHADQLTSSPQQYRAEVQEIRSRYGSAPLAKSYRATRQRLRWAKLIPGGYERSHRQLRANEYYYDPAQAGFVMRGGRG
jgi:glycosyltransferase involved in cell wall biosynthesis